MQRSGSILRSYSRHSRRFSTSPPPSTSKSAVGSSDEKIVASVLFERLPIVIPKIHPAYYAFQKFSLEWGRMSVPEKKVDPKKPQKKQPISASEKLDSISKGDYELEYKRVPWNGNADKDGNRRSQLRALDRRLYLLIYGCPHGIPSMKPVWHFPEKAYETERTLRECAESALKAVIGDTSHAQFIANAPIAHMTIRKNDTMSNTQLFKRFFFKSQVIGNTILEVENCEDHVWVTKDEIMEYFPENVDLLEKMIIN